ncbi:Nucleobase-ascorbate transporter 11 [Hibiscus syriacus]|uniref:Nucleobase-ascorbate transporter 11 n=1 Tax=Hibiscus syriacus TaxID=106335 RepID=A0A6A2ZSD4_HIBSY|nr:nucleobase-ascorbate transporter 11-like [Hibiscus syriacus]KAE8694062.1 Nucleobase-ascorbate transporter 11 [Hibiscus syriacus]
MEKGSNSDSLGKSETSNGRGGKLASMLPTIEPFVPKRDQNHNPRELRSWAKRTGFVSHLSGETGTASSTERFDSSTGFNVERSGRDHRAGGSSPKIEIDPVLGRTRPNMGTEIQMNSGSGSGSGSKHGRKTVADENGNNGLGEKIEERKAEVNGDGNVNAVENGNGVASVTPVGEEKNKGRKGERDVEIGMYPRGEEQGHEGWNGNHPGLKVGLRDNPGFGALIYYGLQHFLSLAGSLIFIPSVMVPAMGGTDKDTATMISTMLLLSGISTILHSYFGTRLPLVQGSSFIYLAPALVIINARDHRNLSEHKFRHIMRELQGAIIVGSLFQSILGFSGLMCLILRLINPVVVAPTVAAVGLAFFSYGFPQAGSCIEVSVPLILLVLICTLYLQGVSIFGHRFFRIYAVPLSVMLTWIYAFFLTAGGAYDYKDCSPDIPSSNILLDECKKHAYTMKHCRTDVSNAWRGAAWVRIPYPLQWGVPIFHFRTSLIMIFVSLVASVDSVGTYHSASLLVSSKPPTPGVVSRGIALEGFCSLLAGFWGSGTGSTTLMENTHTINITKMASRRAVVFGALFLILFSLVGKVGAILASIPLSLAAAILCFMWALVVAIGLSTLQYTQTASFRNITIVGVSLFLGLSIPAYFQQYQPMSSLMLPSYFVPYAAASDGPVHTGSEQLDFAVNALMSMSMVVTLLVAFVLDNTVPGSLQERGVYIWSRPEDVATDPSLLLDYSLPGKFASLCRCSRCL